MKKIESKKLLALTTFICLLPIALYLFVYDRLPEYMVQHWGADGSATWAMQRQWAIFVLPLFFTIIHLVVVFVAHLDPKRESYSVMRHFVFWIIPVASIFTNLIILFANLYADFDVGTIVLVFVGLLFIILGNYMPKVRQNYLVGFRLPWTLNDADNWNKTHRFAGRLMVLGGIMLILGVALPLSAPAFGALMALALVLSLVVPTVYSFMLYRKTRESEE